MKYDVEELLLNPMTEEEYKNNKKKRRFKNLTEDIRYWYNNLFIFTLYYNIKNGLRNLWTYKSVIWNDRWYDYSYIFNILEFKLEQNIKNWDKAHYVGSEFTKGRMIICLQRIREYNTNLENLQELLFTKKISKHEYISQKDKLMNRTWKSFGRNIQRFWD